MFPISCYSGLIVSPIAGGVDYSVSSRQVYDYFLPSLYND